MGVPLDICAKCYCEALALFSAERPQTQLMEISFVVDDTSIASELHRLMKKKWTGALLAPLRSSIRTSSEGSGSKVTSFNLNTAFRLLSFVTGTFS